MKAGVRRFILRGLILAVSLLLSAGESAAAPEASPHAALKGTYARTVSRACIFTDIPFGIDDPDPGDISVGGTVANLGFPQARWTAISGSIVFNGDGTGSMESVVGRIRLTSHGVTSADGTSTTRSSKIPGRPFDRRMAACTFDYEVFPGGSFVMSGFSCDSENLAKGRNSSSPSRTTGIVVHGQMGPGGQTLLLNDNDTNVETISVLTAPGGDPTGVTRQRICIRSGTAVRVGK